MLRYTILGLLRQGERIHGYALWKAYERRSGHRIQNGKFYRALKGLSEAGLIRTMTDPLTDPRRTPYGITATGIAEFDRWILTLTALDVFPEDPISGRALFVFELPQEAAEAFFAGLEDVLSARWKRIEYDRERVLSRPGTPERDRSVRSLLLTRDLERTSADLIWLREARRSYASLQSPAIAAAEPAAAKSLSAKTRTTRATR